MNTKLLLGFLVAIIFASCEFEESDYKYNMGNDFISDPTTVFMIDTLMVSTYTTAVDSITTSRTNRLLAGKVTSEYGIETYCEAYFNIDPSYSPVFQVSAEYDSVCLVLNLDGYNYGDTTKAGEFEVYRLTELVKVEVNSQHVYNTSKFAAQNTPMAKFNVDYSNAEKEISIKLSDAFGKELYNMIQEGGDVVKEKELFEEYFKGLVIRPVEGKTSFVAGFFAVPDSSKSPSIKVYYHDNSTVDELALVFPLEKYQLSNGSSTTETLNFRAFNHISNNFSHSVLKGIASGEEKLLSNLTQNVSFIQTGALFRTRIEIPTIDDLYQFGIGSIIKAELYLEPAEGTFYEKQDLPSMLQMTIIDQKNRYFKPLYKTGTEGYEYGYLNFDREFKNKSNYTYDITYFVKTEYEDIKDPSYSLLLTIPYDPKYPSLDQLVIGNTKNVENKMKLKVYLTNY